MDVVQQVLQQCLNCRLLVQPHSLVLLAQVLLQLQQLQVRQGLR
jgi:hypothetical protein